MSQEGNFLFKYADDTYLLVPATNTHTIPLELLHIENWAKQNNLTLNKSKTVEVIFHKPGFHKFSPPPPSLGINRVPHVKVLGVTLSGDFSLKHHVEELVASSAQSLFALKTLKSHGLPPPALSSVTRATLISKLSYCSAAWRGFTSVNDLDRLDSVLNRAKRWGLYSPGSPSLNEIRDIADKKFFSKILSTHHSLHFLLPPIRSHSHFLPQPTSPLLFPCKNPLSSKNFIPRMLFKDIY